MASTRKTAYIFTELTDGQYTKQVYVIGRNRRGGAALQHLLPPGVGTVTACGVDISTWSYEYITRRFEHLCCRRNACRA